MTFWYCERCGDWEFSELGASDADRESHMSAHAVELADEEPTSDDTALNLKYAAWGTTLLLGLLSAHWKALAVVVPFAALIAWVLTYREGGEG